ncbi:MAG: LamG domain-containing protein [Candidatus Poribacteria bacterium]|nr:LamG domain-containing protein [Candidatus Poribacteria bacterium]
MKKLLYFLIVAIISFMLSLQVIANTFVTDGLVSYWPLDKPHIFGKKAKDRWGDNNAAIKGNPEIVTGQIGDALQFDGVDDYVNLTNLGDFGSQIGSSSFEAWIKVDGKHDWMSLFGVEDDCMQWNFSIRTNIRDDIDHVRLRMAFKMKFEQNGCQGFTSLRGLPKISDGKWHHLVYSSNIYIENFGARRKILGSHIYVDGKTLIGPKPTVRHSELLIPFEKPVYLGANNRKGAGTLFFKGGIDEVRIYNRPLSEAEVIQNFESRIGYSVEPINKLPITWATLKANF